MKMPPRPVSGAKIPKGYWGDLWDYIRSLTLRGGCDDIVVKHTVMGTTITTKKRYGSARAGIVSGKTPYTGTFEVTIENGLLNVDEGWLNRNGEWLTVPAVEGIEPATGWLCVCSTIINGDWTAPELRVETPSADAFPIAEIKVENDSITVWQLPVAVAMIMLAKVCPMAEF